MSFLKKSDLDTPFIAADISRVKANIQRMQKLADEHGKMLRPHAKTHKLPVVALWQIEAGAVGICVQKTDEAEVMVKHGVKDVFVSNEVIGIQKTDRLACLASMSKIYHFKSPLFRSLQIILEFCPPLHWNLLLDSSGKNSKPKKETAAEQG